MKSKEAIRNKILAYTKQSWGTKSTNNINPLFQLMVEEVSNELYLLDNRLNDIDATILEKLVEKLAPSTYNYVRPAHGILQIRPGIPVYNLKRRTEFNLKELPDYLKVNGNKPPVFSPLTDVKLHDLSIGHIFFGRSLWAVDEHGNKSLTAKTEKKALYNTVWLQLHANIEIKVLNNLFFYIDFPHLNDAHDYYDLLPTIKWCAAKKMLKAKKGFPLEAASLYSNTEKDIFNFYESHYQTITDDIQLNDISIRGIPGELSEVLAEDIISSLPKENWLSITFPPHFEEADLEKMIIILNAFPVLNRRYNEYRQIGQGITNMLSLPSEIGEEFLEIESVSDTNNNVYSYFDASNKKEGCYTYIPIRKKRINDMRMYDHLERFIDIIQSEKTTFPEINEEKVLEVLNVFADIHAKEDQRLDLNRMNEYADVARLSLYTYDNKPATLIISYWTTLAEQLNELEAGTALMATVIPELNKNKAILLTPVNGGKTFYDMESQKAINRFFLTSKGRILTKHDIISYCQLEIGKYAENIEAVRSVKISHRFKEGLINVMEIRIKPKVQYWDYLNKKEIIKDLLTRLVKRSPNNYNYIITIIDEK
jgi:hypothetical protein